MPERATDAETLEGEADKFPDASQIKDNYETLTSVVTGVSGTATIAHGLSRIPKQLIVYGKADNSSDKPFHGTRCA
jgi:hypothetical protein